MDLGARADAGARLDRGAGSDERVGRHPRLRGNERAGLPLGPAPARRMEQRQEVDQGFPGVLDPDEIGRAFGSDGDVERNDERGGAHRADAGGIALAVHHDPDLARSGLLQGADALDQKLGIATELASDTPRDRPERL
jgi:hypothetical protein